MVDCIYRNAKLSRLDLIREFVSGHISTDAGEEVDTAIFNASKAAHNELTLVSTRSLNASRRLRATTAAAASTDDASTPAIPDLRVHVLMGLRQYTALSGALQALLSEPSEATTKAFNRVLHTTLERLLSSASTADAEHFIATVAQELVLPTIGGAAAGNAPLTLVQVLNTSLDRILDRDPLMMILRNDTNTIQFGKKKAQRTSSTTGSAHSTPALPGTAGSSPELPAPGEALVINSKAIPIANRSAMQQLRHPLVQHYVRAHQLKPHLQSNQAAKGGRLIGTELLDGDTVDAFDESHLPSTQVIARRLQNTEALRELLCKSNPGLWADLIKSIALGRKPQFMGLVLGLNIAHPVECAPVFEAELHIQRLGNECRRLATTAPELAEVPSEILRLLNQSAGASAYNLDTKLLELWERFPALRPALRSVLFEHSAMGALFRHIASDEALLGQCITTYVANRPRELAHATMTTETVTASMQGSLAGVLRAHFEGQASAADANNDLIQRNETQALETLAECMEDFSDRFKIWKPKASAIQPATASATGEDETEGDGK